MRAVIREILARRMPHPPEEFVAIQLSRLNEALLVAYSAMSPTNLKAVDQVVKIVRELDRYGGAFAAEWARPEASRAEPGERSPAFGGALFCSAELGLQDYEAAPAGLGGDNRPENPAHRIEKVESAPGSGATLGAPRERRRPAPTIARTPQPFLPTSFRIHGSSPERPKEAPLDRPIVVPAGDTCPENPAQRLEKVKSAPGIGLSSQTAEAAPADPVSTPDLVLSLLRSGPGRQILRSLLEHVTSRDVWRRFPAWRWRLSVPRPGRTRPPGKPRASP